MGILKEVFIQTMIKDSKDCLVVDEDKLVSKMNERCMQALTCIKNIVTDDTLDDVACFARIEQIIIALEDAGINTGNRHDFG